jgi:uncharacterized membrane protein
MRACFLGQNICALGFGVATLQAPPLVMDEPAEETPASPAKEHVGQINQKETPAPLPPPFPGARPL